MFVNFIASPVVPRAEVGIDFVADCRPPFWATSHLGDKIISRISTDPVKHKQIAFAEAAQLKGQGGKRCF